MNSSKYEANPTVPMPNRKWPSRVIDKAPIWCSVDLRDGNQALEVPMTLDQKVEFFTFLCEIGFKEIEIGFPAASETDYNFCRYLIDNDLIPDGVAIQVLTQSRPHIIEKTMEAVKGCKKAIIHLYNSTSTLQRDVVFGFSPDDCIDLAEVGARLIQEHISKDEMYQIEELTLTGGLNGSDFSLIRDMAGVTFKFNGSSGHEVYELSPTNGNLKSLDLAGAKILKGGNPYLIVDVAPGARSLTRTGSDYDYYTEDNNISSRLFYATNLETIIIPSSVISISPSAFEKCDMLNTLVVPDGNQIYDSRDNCNAIIESATNQLIAGCKNTYIPNNVTSIGPSAFHTCTNLNSITIPSGVISIGDNAFNSCYNLSSITIPNSVISIGDNAFSFCYGLSSIIIPNSVYSISYGAFYNCSNLTSVTIPNSVISIGISAFERCSSLASITIPNSVSYIGSSAFSGTAWYDNQPNGLIYAGKTAYKFKGEMPAKTHITIKDETLGISGNAFNGCSGMTSITIPNSVTYIGAYAFSGTAWYDNQPDGLVYAGKVAYQYKGKMPANTHITIKDGTLGISGSAFYTFYSTNLTSISIPNSVTSIGESAFYNCSSLASISIPNSVTFIGGAAFYHCNNLTVIVSEIEKIFRIEKSVFYSYDKDIYATATLIVPKGTKAAYQATEGWNKFANIFEVGDVNCDNKINNDDLNALVSYIMGKIPANFNAKVADLNNDGKVNVADVTILVKIIKNIQ